jgi:hypothetical protein
MFRRTAAYYRDYENKRAAEVNGDQYECTRLYGPVAIEGCAPRRNPKLSIVIDFILVEAGGVEPPSEKARREENYVRIRLMRFGGRLRTGESGGNLVRLGFSRLAPDRSFWPIPQDDAH